MLDQWLVTMSSVQLNFKKITLLLLSYVCHFDCSALSFYIIREEYIKALQSYLLHKVSVSALLRDSRSSYGSVALWLLPSLCIEQPDLSWFSVIHQIILPRGKKIEHFVICHHSRNPEVRNKIWEGLWQDFKNSI